MIQLVPAETHQSIGLKPINRNHFFHFGFPPPPASGNPIGSLTEQEALGLDILVHGEAERTDMVEFFGQQLDGFAFTTNGWVQVNNNG